LLQAAPLSFLLRRDEEMAHVFLLQILLAALLVPSVTHMNKSMALSSQNRLSSIEKAGLTTEQRRRADEIISVFENETTNLQYDYTEELGDGRGLTAGRAGFTTATGDLALVVQRYVARSPDSPLNRFLPRLNEVARQESASMEGLEGLSDAWKEAAQDPVFREVQDQVVEELYFSHALKWWKALGAHTPLSLLLLYDTVIQHGDGDDPDGLPAIIGRAMTKAGGSPKTGINEADWFNVFLDMRRETLAHAYNEASRDEWAESVNRCDALRSIAQDGNYDLHGPITIAPFGTAFTIE
jgi:chitosanase